MVIQVNTVYTVAILWIFEKVNPYKLLSILGLAFANFGSANALTKLTLSRMSLYLSTM